MIKKIIGDTLRNRRKELSLSVPEVREKLLNHDFKVGTKAIYSWETGERQPDADIFLILCQIYKIDNILEYFGLADSSNSQKNNLTSQENSIIKKYRALDERGKNTIDKAIDEQYEYVKPKIEDTAM